MGTGSAASQRSQSLFPGRPLECGSLLPLLPAEPASPTGKMEGDGAPNGRRARSAANTAGASSRTPKGFAPNVSGGQFPGGRGVERVDIGDRLRQDSSADNAASATHPTSSEEEIRGDPPRVATVRPRNWLRSVGSNWLPSAGRVNSIHPPIGFVPSSDWLRPPEWVHPRQHGEGWSWVALG
jgi:hypothetical protein